MQATIAAVLLDPEARRGDSATTADASDGKLREPVGPAGYTNYMRVLYWPPGQNRSLAQSAHRVALRPMRSPCGGFARNFPLNHTGGAIEQIFWQL